MAATRSGASTLNASTHPEPGGMKQRDVSEDRIFFGEGWFQAMIHGWCAIAVLTFMCHAITFKFSALNMNHWCQQPQAFSNLTVDEWKQMAIPLQENGVYSSCTMYDIPTIANTTQSDPATFPKNTMNRTVVPCTSWDFDKTHHGNTIVSQWSLVCSHGRYLVMAKVLSITGGLFPVPLLGIAADHAGRRPILCACVVILFVAGFTSALTSSYSFFVFARFVVSTTSSTIMIIMIVMAHEVSSPAKRLVYAAVNILLMMAIVPMVFPLLAYRGISWREVYVIVMVPTSFLVGIFYMVQESPRWLLASWNLKSAEQVVLLATRVNGASIEQARLSLNRAAKSMQRLNHAKDAKKGALLIALTGLLLHPLHRKNSIILFGAWSSIIFTLYIVSFNDILNYQNWAETAYIAATVPVYTAVYFSMRQLGRKKTIIASALSLSMSSVVLAVIYNDNAPTFAGSALALIIRLSVKVAAAAMFIFTTEIYPTMLRCIGVSFSFSWGRVGGILGTLVVEYVPMHRKDIILLLISFMMCLGAISMQLLPDTSTCVTKSMKAPPDRKEAVDLSISPETCRSPPQGRSPTSSLSPKQMKRGREENVPFNW